MARKLKVENGPTDLSAAVTDRSNRRVVRFDAEGETCETTVGEIEVADATGTCWRISGAFTSGKLKGRHFSGNYNAETRKGLFDVGRIAA
jgi:hypothetical protein